MTSPLPIKDKDDVIVIPDSDPEEPIFIKRIKPLNLGSYCYVQLKNDNNKNWYKAAVTGIKRDNDKKHKIIYELMTFHNNLKNKQIPFNCYRQIALYDAPKFRLKLGAKVIGKFRFSSETGEFAKHKFVGGIIAEQPQHMNGYRYLVFFYGNQAGYLYEEDLRIILDDDNDDDGCPWNGFDGNNQSYIRNYFNRIDKHGHQPNPFHQLESVFFIYNDMATQAVVLKVDCSLVLVFLYGINCSLCLYHGSPYLKSIS